MTYQRQYSRNEYAIAKKIGINIRKARDEMGMSLEKVAKTINFPKSKLWEIEQGTKIASSVLLVQLANLFDVSVTYFFSGREMSVGEELFFDASRAIAPVKMEMDKFFVNALTHLAATMFPAQVQSELLTQEVLNAVEQFERLLQLNAEGAWQDMKGGQKFESKMRKLFELANEVHKANSIKNRAKKEVREQVQLGLF